MRLKRALYLSAFASLREPASRAYYDRKRAEGKDHRSALVCLARRRTNVLYAMLASGSAYTSRRTVRSKVAGQQRSTIPTLGYRSRLDQEILTLPNRQEILT